MAKLLPALLIAAVAVAACSDTPPASPAPPSGGGDTISGTERIGWTQPAGSAGELSQYRYAVYVDGTRRLLENATCATTVAADGFPCEAPLPTLTPGAHTLEIAAFVLADGGAVLEGPRSAPLRVTVRGSTTPAASEWPTRLISPDGLTLDVALVADGLIDPVDLAVAADGTVVVAERGGRVRLYAESLTSGDDADNVFAWFRRDGEAELLSIAVSADFDRTGQMYLAIRAARDGDAAIFVVRVRVLRGLMGEAAVLSTHAVPAGTDAVLRIGPDGHLFLGVGGVADPPAAQRLSDAAGKILRLRDDGGVPDTNPWSSPVWSVGHGDLRGLAWRAETLWSVEGDEPGDEVNAIRRGANYGWPLVRGAASHPHVTRPAFVLPAGTDVSGITAVLLPSSPLADSLIVAARGTEALLRVRLETGRRQQATSALVADQLGPIAQVASAPDGSLLLITTHGTAGDGHDMLVRLSPVLHSSLPPRTP